MHLTTTVRHYEKKDGVHKKKWLTFDTFSWSYLLQKHPLEIKVPLMVVDGMYKAPHAARMDMFKFI